MTLDQFLGACLGLGLVMLARLLDRWLPPTEGHPETAPAAAAPQVPSIRDLDMIREPDEPPDDS